MKVRSWFWAIFNFVFGLGLPLLIFFLVPEAEAWLKIFGIVFGIGFVVSSIGYIYPNRFLIYWIVITNLLLLIVGVLIIVGIINSAIYLKGIYGPMGEGASAVMWALVALFLPYLVIFPLLQIYYLKK